MVQLTNLVPKKEITFDELKSTYDSLIPQIRTISPGSLIMVTGLDWGRDINAWLDNPLAYNNIVYRTNPYNKTGEFESYFGRIANQYPIFLGEFGTQDKLSMTITDVKNILGYADSLGVGWTAWHFTSTGCPCLLSDENIFTPSQYGLLVKNALAGQRYPYPMPEFNSDQSRLYVYSNFLESGFADYSWGITNELGKAISTNFHNSAGLFLSTSRRIDTLSYKNFILSFQTDSPENFSLRFKSWDNKLSNSIQLTNGVNTISTSLINLQSTSGIMIETTSKITDPSPITVDEIYFQK